MLVLAVDDMYIVSLTTAAIIGDGLLRYGERLTHLCLDLQGSLVLHGTVEVLIVRCVNLLVLYIGGTHVSLAVIASMPKLRTLGMLGPFFNNVAAVIGHCTLLSSMANLRRIRLRLSPAQRERFCSTLLAIYADILPLDFAEFSPIDALHDE